MITVYNEVIFDTNGLTGTLARPFWSVETAIVLAGLDAAAMHLCAIIVGAMAISRACRENFIVD